MADGDFSFPEAGGVEELSRFDLNDHGNAMRFIRLTGGQLVGDEVDLKHASVLYLRDRGWIAYNGRYWDLQHGDALAQRAAVKVATALPRQMEARAAELTAKGAAPRTIAACWEFATQCGNAGRLNAMRAVAASFLEVDLDGFDQDPLALNCANGVLRFVRGPDGQPVARFRPGHVPSDRMTRITRANYDPAAPAAVFERVVADAQPNPDTRDFMQRVLGYSATGSTEEQKFFIFQGKGGDGKSTIVNAVRGALGTYATTVAVETFLDTGLRRGADASPDIADLAGDSRLLCAGEPPSGSKLATGALKTFTGGGSLKARELRQGLFEFSPIGKPLIECNRRPGITDADNGIWRRLKVVPFMHPVPIDQVDGALPRKLEAEQDGILGWIVEGVLAWMAEGLRREPPEVSEAIEDYRKGSNLLTQWMADCIVLDREARTRATELFNSYKRWMEDNGHDKPMSQKAFGAALGDLQIVWAGKDGDGKVTRRGARLRDGLGERDRGGVAPAAEDDIWAG